MTDLPIDLRDLSRDRKSIAALAAHLIADIHGGEDLAQESVYRLLRSGGPRGPGNRLAWLRTTVRRLAVNEHRDRASRRHREREAARPEAMLSSDQIAERAELCHRVHLAIESLTREHASVLRDHYFGDLTASEMAARDDLPVNTIKSRIRRARAALRNALEEDGVRGDLHWSIALAPLAAGAPLGAPPGVAAVSLPAGAVGSVLIMKKLISFAAVLVALIIGVRVLSPAADREGAPAGADGALEVADARVLDSDDELHLASTEPQVSDRAIIAPQSNTSATKAVHLPTTRLFGRVIDSDGAPLSDVLVQISRPGKWSDVEVEGVVTLPDGRVGLTSRTNSDGEFELRVPFSGVATATLDVIPGEYRTRQSRYFRRGEDPELRAGDVDLGDITLATAGAIAGRVVDAGGNPISGVDLQIGPSLGTTYGLLANSACKSGADGSFVLGHVPVGQHGLAVEVHGFASRFVDLIGVERHKATGVGDIVLERIPVPTMRGRILDEEGHGIPRQWLSAHPKVIGRPIVLAKTDETGRFELGLKSTGSHMLNVKRRGYEIVGGVLAKGPYLESTTDSITIQLTPLPRTTFKLVDAETDEAIEAFGLKILRDSGSKAPKRVHRSGPPLKMAQRAGGILVAGAREGVDLVQVNAEGYRPFKGDVEHDVAGEGTQTIRLRAAARATGRVLLDGQPAVGVAVIATVWPRHSDRGPVPETMTAEDGRFVLVGLNPGMYRIAARSSDGTRSGEAILRVGDERTLDVGTIDLRRSGSIEGNVLLPPGVHPEGLSVYLDDWQDGIACTVSSTGTFRLGEVEPGQHRVTLVERPGELVSAPRVAVTVVTEQVARTEIDARDCGMTRVTLTIDVPGVAPEDITVHVAHDMLEADPAKRARHQRGGPVRMLKPDGLPGRFTGFERASGRALIRLRIERGSPIILPEPVLILKPFGEVERDIHVELGSLSIALPESLEIPANAKIEATLRRSGHAEPMQSFRIRLENGVPLDSGSRGATLAGRTITIESVLSGKLELEFHVYPGNDYREVTHADGTTSRSRVSVYEATLPIECVPGEVTHVPLP